MSNELISVSDYRVALPAPPSSSTMDEDKGESRFGWIIVALFFGLFVGFAAIVRLDAAAYAEGIVKVAGSRQAVQHRDGGVISALNVKEGQHVKAGQVLIQLAGAEVAANERALASQVIGLWAERARLQAERLGAPSIATPPEFATLSDEDRKMADDALRLQGGELAARRSAISSQKKVLGQQAAQLNQKIAGLGRQMEANQHQNSLFDDELKGMRSLAQQGFASVNRVRELERAQSSVSGDTANLSATSAAAREQIGETQMQALSLDTQNMQQVSEDLHKNEESLNDALPKWQAARQQLAQTQIRATASGQVVGLDVFTVGGVIQAGQKLMEIVPDAAPLVIEAKISPTDADDLYVGQTAEIRFTALHERDMPVFEGKVTRLSADSFSDEKTGQTFYTGEVTVPAEDIAEVKKIKGKDSEGIKPGLPVQVLVPLKKRTLLQYLFEPISQALWRSGREH